MLVMEGCMQKGVGRERERRRRLWWRVDMWREGRTNVCGADGAFKND